MTRSAPRPTLKTIAEASGLAVQTVSRALGDAPDISPRTKERVRRIADELGYVPNRAGVRLRTGRTQVIALVLSTDHDVLNLTSRLIGSIAEALRETPYHLVMTPDFPDADPLDAVRYIVHNGTADAIIINRTRPRDPRVRFLLDEGFPFATHGRTLWADRHAYYDYDNRAFGAQAVRTLAEKGRRTLLLLAPPQDENYALEIIGGARAAARDVGTRIVIADGVTSDSHRDQVRSYITRKLAADPGIDGLISASPNGTMAAVAGAEDAGRQIGEDLDVFSKETVPILELFRPGILTLREDVTRAGRFLARAAVAAAKRDGSAPMQAMDRPAN